jgi:ankyrin repeat protein
MEQLKMEQLKNNVLLIEAATKGNLDVVIDMLNKNADIEFKPTDKTPLMCAIENSFYSVNQTINIIIELLERKANIEVRNENGETPLHIASGAGYRENKELVTLLLKYNANIEALDNNNNTPLHIASVQGYYKIVEELLNHGANVNAKNIKNNTPLHIVSQEASFSSCYRDIAVLLLNQNAAISTKNEYGRTPLHCAAISGDIKMIQELIDHNADITGVDDDDYTPYDHAIRECYSDSIIELLEPRDKIINSSQEYKDELVKKFTCKSCDKHEIRVALRCGHMICKDCSRKLFKCKICDCMFGDKIKLNF